MANFVNNEPKFKVGDKVVYSRRRAISDQVGWEIESIRKGPLTISKVDKFYSNDELVDVTYSVEGLDYVYSEGWLDYAPAGPKFKIGDLVYVNPCMKTGAIIDIVTKTYASDGHQEYLYKINFESTNITFYENSLAPTSLEETLIHDLEICGNKRGDCDGCSYKNSNGTKMHGCYNQINLDAAELIKKLQKRVKELEEEKK